MKQYVLKAVGTRDLQNLTKDKLYTSLRGKEEGIFENSPYVTIIDDYNKRFSLHFNRFEIVEEYEEVQDFNEAKDYFQSRDEIIYERMLDYEKNGDKCLVSKEEVLKLLKEVDETIRTR